MCRYRTHPSSCRARCPILFRASSRRQSEVIWGFRHSQYHIKLFACSRRSMPNQWQYFYFHICLDLFISLRLPAYFHGCCLGRNTCRDMEMRRPGIYRPVNLRCTTWSNRHQRLQQIRNGALLASMSRTNEDWAQAIEAHVAQVNKLTSEPIASSILLPDSNFAQFIDHTLLKSNATPSQIDQLCNEAIQYKFKVVLIVSIHVRSSRSKRN